MKDLFAETDDKAVKAEQDRVKKEIEALPFSGLSLEGFDGEHMKELFGRPEWESLSGLPGLRHLHVHLSDLPVL